MLEVNCFPDDRLCTDQRVETARAVLLATLQGQGPLLRARVRGGLPAEAPRAAYSAGVGRPASANYT